MAEHGRLIDADALLAEYDRLHEGPPGKARTLIENAPTIEPERPKGKWIRNDNGTWSCDQCYSWIPDEQHYYANWCLYCGADMRGEKDEGD